MLKDKVDILRFIKDNPGSKYGDIVNNFLDRGKEFAENLSSYMVELKRDKLLDFPTPRPTEYCWIKLTIAGLEYLENLDRQLEQEAFNRDQLLKRVEAAERTASAFEAELKESRRIADAAEIHAKLAEENSISSDKKAKRANWIAFGAFLIQLIDLILNRFNITF